MRWLGRLGVAVAGGLAILAAAVVIGLETWPWEILNHFVRHFATLSLLAALCLFLLRRPRAAFFGAGVTALWVGIAWHAAVGLEAARPRLAAPPPGPVAQHPASLTVLTFNALRHNRRTAAVWAAIERVGADVVTLQEVSPTLAAAITGGRPPLYPHTVVVDVGGDYDAVALLSRWPIRTWSAIKPFDGAWTALRAVIEPRPGHPVTIVSLHAWPPSTRRRLAGRDVYLRHIARRIAVVDMPVVVSGDFNATPFTPVFRRFLATAGVAGDAPAPASWPSQVGALGIPIDHILARGLLIRDLTAHAGPGSDHRFLTARLDFAPNKSLSDPKTGLIDRQRSSVWR